MSASSRALLAALRRSGDVLHSFQTGACSFKSGFAPDLREHRIVLKLCLALTHKGVRELVDERISPVKAFRLLQAG